MHVAGADWPDQPATTAPALREYQEYCPPFCCKSDRLHSRLPNGVVRIRQYRDRSREHPFDGSDRNAVLLALRPITSIPIETVNHAGHRLIVSQLYIHMKYNCACTRASKPADIAAGLAFTLGATHLRRPAMRSNTLAKPYLRPSDCPPSKQETSGRTIDEKAGLASDGALRSAAADRRS